MRVGPDKTVAFDYRLYDEEGVLIESNPEDEPLCFVFGTGSIIPGLERALEGMQPGESKEVVVSPEDAYGLKDPDLIQRVPREHFSGSSSLEVGMSYVGRTEAGQIINFLILGLDDQMVEIDMNHPMAGKILRFEVTVKDVQDSPF